MKVYTVMYSHCDDWALLGIFGSREKAQYYLDNLPRSVSSWEDEMSKTGKTFNAYIGPDDLHLIDICSDSMSAYEAIEAYDRTEDFGIDEWDVQ